MQFSKVVLVFQLNLSLFGPISYLYVTIIYKIGFPTFTLKFKLIILMQSSIIRSVIKLVIIQMKTIG